MFSIGSFFYIPVGISGDAGSCLSPSDQVIDPLHERALGLERSWPECAAAACQPVAAGQIMVGDSVQRTCQMCVNTFCMVACELGHWPPAGSCMQLSMRTQAAAQAKLPPSCASLLSVEGAVGDTVTVTGRLLAMHPHYFALLSVGHVLPLQRLAANINTNITRIHQCACDRFLA